MIDGAPWDPTKIDAFTSLIGKSPAIVMWYQSWANTGSKEFSPTRMNAVVARGAMPMVTWEPHDYTRGVDQPTFALRVIASGTHDAYIRQWARDAKAWGKPFYLRFGHEMNGNWYSWGQGVNGNSPEHYIAAWRRIVNIFRAEGTTNVRWVWCPMAGRPFTTLYPGDSYVDWVGLDGYNWGTSQSWSSWKSMLMVFGSSYTTLASMTTKPILIGETASATVGGDKAAWIRQGFLTDLPTKFPRIKAVIWFHKLKEADWRINSSATTLDAYKAAVVDSRYQGRLP